MVDGEEGDRLGNLAGIEGASDPSILLPLAYSHSLGIGSRDGSPSAALCEGILMIASRSMNQVAA